MAICCGRLGTTPSSCHNKTMLRRRACDLPQDNLRGKSCWIRPPLRRVAGRRRALVDNSTNRRTTSATSTLNRARSSDVGRWWHLYATVSPRRRGSDVGGLRAPANPDAERPHLTEDGPDSSARWGEAAIGLIGAIRRQLQAATTDDSVCDVPGAAKPRTSSVSQSSDQQRQREQGAQPCSSTSSSPARRPGRSCKRPWFPSSPVVRQAIREQATATDAAVYRIYDAVADRMVPQGRTSRTIRICEEWHSR